MRRLIIIIIMLSMITLLRARGGTDYYTAGFYTRGADAAYYLDSGDPIYDPFYMPVRRMAWVPRLSISLTREGQLDQESGRDEAGFVIRVVPGAMLIWGRPQGRHLYLDYGISIPTYDTGRRFDGEPSHLLTVGGVFRTPKSQFHAEFGLRRLEDLETLIGARLLKHDYVADIAAEHRISVKSTLGVLGGFERHRYTEARYYGYDRYYGALRLYHDISLRSQVFAQGGIGHDDVDSGPEGYGDADFHDLSLGIRGKPTPKTDTSGRIGYQWRRYDDEQRADLERWIASLSARVNPFGFTTFSARLSADIRPAINELGTSIFDRQLACGLTRRLYSDRLRGRIDLMIGRTDYYRRGGEPLPRERTVSQISDRRQDNYWGFSLALGYTLIKNLSLGLSYTYTENRAIVGLDDRVRTTRSHPSGIWNLRFSWNY